MVKPFYQGKLDTFCAIYAVLNAWRLLFGIRVSKARDMMNTVLLNLGTRPAAFSEVLTMMTDYIDLVDDMLETQSRILPFEYIQPWGEKDTPTEDEFWEVASRWIGGQQGGPYRRTMVFRFLRHIKADTPPTNRHWTTADYIDSDILHLFDSSHEAEAILNIRRDSFATSPSRLGPGRLLFIQPKSVRLISLRA